MKNVYHFTYMGTSPLISHPLQVTKVTYVRRGRAPHSNKYLRELLLLSCRRPTRRRFVCPLEWALYWVVMPEILHPQCVVTGFLFGSLPDSHVGHVQVGGGGQGTEMEH